MKNYAFDIALSFAEEDASAALTIYLALKLNKGNNSIFHYKDTIYTSGKILKTELPDLYKHKSRFVVMLVSKNYINPDKTYAPIEANAIIERWKFNQNESFLIPIILDDTRLNEIDASLTKGIAYVRWNGDPEALAAKIWELVRANEADENDQKPPKKKRKKKKKTTKGPTVIFNNKGIKGSITQSGIHNGDNINL